MLLPFAKKNTSSILVRFSMREFIILSLDFSCPCKNSIWSFSREIILPVLLLGSCEWDLMLCLSEVKSSFLNIVFALISAGASNKRRTFGYPHWNKRLPSISASPLNKRRTSICDVDLNNYHFLPVAKPKYIWN